jgi:opacity protein-like surface antigen
MRLSALNVLITIMLLFLTTSLGYADVEYERPKYKISLFTGWGGYDIGELRGIDWLENYTDEPVNRETMISINDRLRNYYFQSDTRDFAGHFNLGYNFSGPWYLVSGFQYEKWDEVRNQIIYTGFGYNLSGKSLFKTTAVIPFIALEYTNKFWKINYNSSVGLAQCFCRTKVNYVGFSENENDLGTFTYNSTGLILSGGLSYELFRYVSLNAQAGYRKFGGKSLEPPAESDEVKVDFDYSGAFWGIGMSYGFEMR